MATFLELAGSLHQEAGLSGSGPASVTGQSGMNKKVVDWINAAWYEIQSARAGWKWMWRNTGSVTTTVGVNEYDLAALGFDTDNLVGDSISIQVTGSPNTIIKLDHISYESFREQTAFYPMVSGQPIYSSLTPGDTLVLNTYPDRQYDIKFEWYVRPSFMSDNGDVPGMPLMFHPMIVELALAKYALHDGAPDVYQVAEKEYAMWMRRLERSQLPTVETIGTLA